MMLLMYSRTFIHGCGLKMIDMGYTMVQETWQIKPAQYLDLYMVSCTMWVWPKDVCVA